jgi:hypothetical protein
MNLADHQNRTPSNRLNPAVFSHYYEGPSAAPAGDEIWCYSDRPCYSPGEVIVFFVSTTAQAYDLEIARGVDQSALFLGSDDIDFHADILYGKVTDETVALAGRGSGMMVSFKNGLGEVFHAGSCEWVAGLLRRDPQVERVTHNVLNRFLKK